MSSFRRALAGAVLLVLTPPGCASAYAQDEAPPRVAEESSQQEEAPLRVAEEKPEPAEASPRIAEEKPQSDETPPQTAAGTPQPEQRPRQIAAEMPRQEETARQIVEATVAQVLGVLRQELPKEERRDRLEKIVYHRFDFRTTARLVLSKNWKKFTDAQQEQFVGEFRIYLANSYGARLDRYSGEQVEVVGERKEPRGDVTIQTKVLGGEYDGALVDYRMRAKAGPWLVIDVIVEGVSLVSNYRDQFREVLSDGGPELLLERLVEKNAAGVVDEV